MQDCQWPLDPEPVLPEPGPAEPLEPGPPVPVPEESVVPLVPEPVEPVPGMVDPGVLVPVVPLSVPEPVLVEPDMLPVFALLGSLARRSLPQPTIAKLKAPIVTATLSRIIFVFS